MGFPNVDIFLASKLIERFNEAKTDPGFIVADLFDDLTTDEQTEVTQYIQRKRYTDDLRDRTDSELFIFPSYPMLHVPLPQIGISLGNENATEMFFRDTVGDAQPYPDEATQTHWAIPKAYLANATYQIDVVCSTKDEVIWLSRFVQRFITEEKDALADIGVNEVSISLQDTMLKSEHQPSTALARTVSVSCTVTNSWTTLIPVQQYAAGNNTAVVNP